MRHTLSPAGDRCFDIAVEVAGERARVRVEGEIDLAAAPAIADALERAAGPCSIVDLDLSRVTFADVPGMRPLWHACLRPDRRVRVVAASPPVRRIASLVVEVMAHPAEPRPARDGRGLDTPVGGADERPHADIDGTWAGVGR